MEGRELGPVLAPLPVGDAEIEIGKGDRDGDRTGRDLAQILLPALLQVVESGLHPQGLALHPFAPLRPLRPHCRLIALGDARFGKGLAECRKGEHAEALHAVIGDQGLVARHMTEIFDDQSNLINMTVRGKIKSLRLTKDTPVNSLTFEAK